MNFSQLRRAVWLRCLSDMGHGRLTLLKDCKSLARIPRRCTAPTARWPIVRDNPNIHLSESIVRPVARVCRLAGLLGAASKATRATFL
jgi:hypothetical protein